LPESESVQRYLEFLMVQNRQINLVSRKINNEQLGVLVGETLRLAKIVTGSCIVDAGSGNGLLGIVLAIHYPQRQVILLEALKKKVDFLDRVVSHLGLENTKINWGRLESFSFPHGPGKISLVARGFPSLQALAEPLVGGDVDEVVTITSLKKIEKLKIPLEKVVNTIYNIPFRDVIKILKMENVSRETINPTG